VRTWVELQEKYRCFCGIDRLSRDLARMDERRAALLAAPGRVDEILVDGAVRARDSAGDHAQGTRAARPRAGRVSSEHDDDVRPARS
jgi:hypothetical protein